MSGLCIGEGSDLDLASDEDVQVNLAGKPAPASDS